jgi:hypothetical protein
MARRDRAGSMRCATRQEHAGPAPIVADQREPALPSRPVQLRLNFELNPAFVGREPRVRSSAVRLGAMSASQQL